MTRNLSERLTKTRRLRTYPLVPFGAELSNATQDQPEAAVFCQRHF